MENIDVTPEAHEPQDVEAYESPVVTDLEAPDGPAVTAAGGTIGN